MRVPFAGNVGNITGRRNSPNLPPGSKGSNGSKAKVRLAKPDTNLVKLKATAKAEELKARIRAAKMMSQGISYSQVVQAQTPVHVAPAPAPAPRIVRTALTPDKAITIFLETIKRLQLRMSPKTASKHLYNLQGGQEDGIFFYA
jgi:hypothetical protein